MAKKAANSTENKSFRREYVLSLLKNAHLLPIRTVMRQPVSRAPWITAGFCARSPELWNSLRIFSVQRNRACFADNFCSEVGRNLT